jgi:Tfp pilus assembly protein PilW
MNTRSCFSTITRRWRDSRASTLAETLVASAIGALVLVGVMTTYIMSIKGFTAISNYRQIHGDGRLAVSYFARDIRGVSSISSFANPSNITVAIPTAFNSSGTVISNKTVSYTTSGGKFSRYDSSTGKTDLLASNIKGLTFTLYDNLGNSNGVTTSTAKGIQLDIKLRKTVMSQVQSEDFLSARYDMRNTAN